MDDQTSGQKGHPGANIGGDREHHCLRDCRKGLTTAAVFAIAAANAAEQKRVAAKAKREAAAKAKAKTGENRLQQPGLVPLVAAAATMLAVPRRRIRGCWSDWRRCCRKRRRQNPRLPLRLKLGGNGWHPWRVRQR